MDGAAQLRIAVHDGISLGRGDKIRTCDPLLPKQVRYQTALRPAAAEYSATRRSRHDVATTAHGLGCVQERVAARRGTGHVASPWVTVA